MQAAFVQALKEQIRRREFPSRITEDAFEIKYGKLSPEIRQYARKLLEEAGVVIEPRRKGGKK
ncbi:MAG: hypothetical protein HYT49_01685 [Candidatus Wildermuthbacteria bacterium]|nr:hypothetical protein [Candidatus Wildermuthbacteria bacterium]